MTQDEFVLKVMTRENAPAEMRQFMEDEGINIGVSVWDNQCGFMIDQEITYMYPGLTELGLDEMTEGDMVYHGELNCLELVNRLREMGFNVVIEGDENNINNPRPAARPAPAPDQPKSKAQLEQDMAYAIKVENYEKCSEIRDEIKRRFGEG